MSKVQIGQALPAFTAQATSEQTISSADLKGKNVVIYFYPKDSTPGCTREAVEFTEKLSEFETANTVIVGVSKDSVRRHDNFIEKNNLGVTLISDEDGAMCEAYGVWVEKKNYGRTYMGIERSTFLVDGSGKIREIWRKVRVASHVEKVLDAAKNLS